MDFSSCPELDVRRVESGGDRDGGNKRERGERAVVKADKVRQFGTRYHGSSFSFTPLSDGWKG